MHDARKHDGPVLFVSHHSSKLQTAHHVEKALAARGVRCWIAPRDVDPGEPFDRAVHKAIGATDAMLLLFCSQSEKSRHVKRELILADQGGKAIIPLRLERIDPGELSYHLADSQWIDWLEQRDDVIDRIAAKAHEFRGERGDDTADALPVDLADVAPSHSAAVGAASDLQPHALGGFPGPSGAAFGGAGFGQAAPPPVPAGGTKTWLWISLGGLILVGAVVLAILLGTRGSNPAPTPTSVQAATPGAAPVTAEWFAGVWGDTRDCAQPYRFDRSGQVTNPMGGQGRWSIEGGDTLVVEGAGTQRNSMRIRRVSDDEVISGDSRIYRCFPGAT